MTTSYTHGKNTVVSVNAQDISQDCESSDLSANVDTVEFGVFGQASKQSLSGQYNYSFTLSGYFDPTATTGSHTVLSGIVQNDSVACIWGPLGSTSGKPKATFNAILKSYKPGSKVGGLVAFSADFISTGNVTWATYP